MKNCKANGSVIASITAFLIGVILLWSIGKNWLDFESSFILLVGLIGVALAVLAFGAWNIMYNSHHKEN